MKLKEENYGRKIIDIYDLQKQNFLRKSVIRKNGAFSKMPFPASVLLQQNCSFLLQLIDDGIYIYKKIKKNINDDEIVVIEKYCKKCGGYGDGGCICDEKKEYKPFQNLTFFNKEEYKKELEVELL